MTSMFLLQSTFCGKINLSFLNYKVTVSSTTTEDSNTTAFMVGNSKDTKKLQNLTLEIHNML